MKLIDLFSGIGGFSLAAHWLGWETIAFVEKDDFCQKVLAKNFKGVPIYDDITTFSGKPFRGRVDIIAGGAPCQGFSVAGQRKGTSDERHLFPEMLRIIREVEPAFVVFENVRGLLNIESGDAFEEICASLERIGYAVQTFIIPACAVNAPHRRDRLWIVAHSGSLRQRGRNQYEAGQGEILPTRSITDFNESTFANPNDKRHFGRSEQGQSGKRQVRSGRGNDRTFGESTIGDSSNAGIFTNSDRFGCSDEQKENGQIVSDKIGQLSTSERIRNIEQHGIGESDSVITDAESSGLEQRRKNAGRLRERARKATERRGFADNASDNASNADRARLQGRGADLRSEGKKSDDEQSIGRGRGWDENWLEVATRLCALDDGLSRGLVRPKGWRVNALKAAGNSIVPQIAFELFKAIEQAENAL